jgi:sec-independent protein translocase protein TatC
MAYESDPSSNEESRSEEPSLFHQLLEGLENFRWMLIKCAVAVIIAMVVCLATENYIVTLLKWPLKQGERQGRRGEQQVALQIGSEVIFRGVMPTNVFGVIPLGTNPIVPLRLVPGISGTNLAFFIEPGDPVADAPPTSERLELKTLGPMAAFTVAIDLAIYGGLFIASPFIFFFIAQFLTPFLKRFEHAQKFVVRLALIMSGLFAAGVSFCYFILLPIALKGSVAYSRWLRFTADTWQAEDYIGFVCKFCLGMGVGFQLPVLLLGLVKIGVLNCARLVKFRAYWLVINLVLSAVITPDGNPLTMVLMAAPLQALFEISIWIARYWERTARKAVAP